VLGYKFGRISFVVSKGRLEYKSLTRELWANDPLDSPKSIGDIALSGFSR